MRVNSILLAILLMFGVTYLIRVAPLLLIRREIKNRTVRSFLFYMPYVALSAMTFPAILFATSAVFSAVAALAMAVLLSLRGHKLPVVALAACLAVFLSELIFL